MIQDMAKDIGIMDHFDLVQENCMVHVWQPLPPDFHKVNVDGSVLWSLIKGGFGAIICSHDGSWVVGTSGTNTCYDVLCMELLAIFNGLSLVW